MTNAFLSPEKSLQLNITGIEALFLFPPVSTNFLIARHLLFYSITNSTFLNVTTSRNDMRLIIHYFQVGT